MRNLLARAGAELAALCRSIAAVPFWVFGLFALLLLVVFSLPAASASPDPAVPSALVESVRAEIAEIAKSSSSANCSVKGVLDESKSHTQLLTEIRDLLKPGPGRRRADESTAFTGAGITLPDGTQTDLLSLAARSTGQFAVEGGRYRGSLLSHGFRDAELPSDESQCRLIYDGWKSGQTVRPVAASGYSPPPARWQCNGKSCRLIR